MVHKLIQMMKELYCVLQYINCCWKLGGFIIYCICDLAVHLLISLVQKWNFLSMLAWYLRLSQWCWWRFKSSVMLHSVTWYIFTNVLQALFSS